MDKGNRVNLEFRYIHKQPFIIASFERCVEEQLEWGTVNCANSIILIIIYNFVLKILLVPDRGKCLPFITQNAQIIVIRRGAFVCGLLSVCVMFYELRRTQGVSWFQA